ncbi:MAG: NAD(P)/FAD-dependent oxidoreductase [Dehalococcoidales bacterium]|jgi:L-2-hydroxyglutarate oxidase LhgO|nr:NAD(P)/FAD-dependent oxidoreductase [Dehalococcoidales bacterium]
MSQITDITIIGAGVVGLAIAAELSGRDYDILLVEKNEKQGLEQSSRNSEVIHAGIYYEKDSLKTRMCLEGNRLLYELCERTGISYHKCGKIIVATDEVEDEELGKLFDRARGNGAEVRMISDREKADLEPNLKGTSAFFAPTTGIVDSHGLVSYLYGLARTNGVQMAFKTEVTGLERASDGYNIRVQQPSGESSFKSRVVVNCAGLHSDKVAEMAGIQADEADYKLNWCKGEFYSVSGGKNKLINRLIYPVPLAISIGAHVCLDVNWRLRLGPLLYYVDQIDYSVDESRRRDVLESSILKALPCIEPADLEPESSGIMAMIQGEGESFRDFVVRHEHDRGLPGLVNLVGIETPGLTSSLALAKYVDRMVKEIL